MPNVRGRENMPKFYAKIDEAVEGPFEPRLLRYLPGFNEETLVSPEDLNSQDWTQAHHVPEIRPHLHLTPELLPPSAFAPRAAAPNVSAPPVSPAESTQRLSDPAVYPPMQAKAAPDQELLDVMEQFSGQIPAASAQKPAAPADIPTFNPPDLGAADVSTLVPPMQEKFIPKKAVKSRKTLWILLAIAVVSAALGYLAWTMGLLDAWLNPAAPPVQVAPPLEPVALPIAEKPVEPPKPPEAKKPAKKAKKAVTPPPPAPKPKPVRQDPLKMQKYMMPGVPSPKMEEKSKTPEVPKPEAEEAKPADEAGRDAAKPSPEKPDDEYERELKKAKKKEAAEKKKPKPKSANDEDYFDFQWIGADPGEKR